MEYRKLTFEEFEKALKSVKRNKAAVRDDIDSNIIIRIYDEISYPLFMVFHSSFNEGIFPEQLKVEKVSTTFKVLAILKKWETIDQYQFFPYSPKF